MANPSPSTCARCGASLPAESRFCAQCGTAVGAAPSSGDLPESDVWRGRVAGKAFSLHWAFSFVFAAIVVALSFIYVSAEQIWPRRILWIVAGIPALRTLWIALAAILSTRYRVTTQRLFVEHGIITRKLEELDLVRVDDVTVRQNIFQRMMNVGEITLASTDASSPVTKLDGIENPVEVKELIRTAVRRQRAKVLRMENV